MRARIRRAAAALASIAFLVVAACVASRLSPDSAGRAGLVRAAVLYGGLGAALALQGGVVSGPVASGAALLWLQKPVDPRAFFGRRMLDAWAVSMAAVAAVAAVTWAVAGVGPPRVGAQVLRYAASTSLLATMAGAIVFTLSAWGVRRDVAGGVVVGVTLAGLRVWLALEPHGLGPLSTLGRTVAMPLEELDPAGRFLVGAPPAGAPGDLLRILAWTAAWCLVAFAGLERTVRRPYPGR